MHSLFWNGAFRSYISVETTLSRVLERGMIRTDRAPNRGHILLNPHAKTNRRLFSHSERARRKQNRPGKSQFSLSVIYANTRFGGGRLYNLIVIPRLYCASGFGGRLG